MFTNINITDNIEQYPYIIEYQVGDIDDISNICYTKDLAFWKSGDENKFIKSNSEWINYGYNELKLYLPNQTKKSTITLYIPLFSPDVYINGLNYALNVGTWIENSYISLGSFIFNRADVMACDRVKRFSSHEYYECIKFDIIDPFSLIYSDEWQLFRENLCGEPTACNNGGSILYFSLHPVELAGSKKGYIKVDGLVGGQNSINISKKVDDYIHLNLSTNTDKMLGVDDEPSFLLETKFNSDYKGDLLTYIKETYGVENPSLKYELVIGNDNDLYAVISNETDVVTKHSVTKSEILEQNFTNWIGWVPGIYVTGSLDILNEDGDSILYILSNKIPFDLEVSRYFIGGNEFEVSNKTINSINLNLIDMNLYEIKTVNKIENKIMQVDRLLNDSKSNIVQPIFFRSVESMDVMIHPEVTENICINLDPYKSKVDSFIIRIEGTDFVEMGRTKSGVLFKIIGNKLPKAKETGEYYILNQDGELVTTGKYNYVV